MLSFIFIISCTSNETRRNYYKSEASVKNSTPVKKIKVKKKKVIRWESFVEGSDLEFYYSKSRQSVTLNYQKKYVDINKFNVVKKYINNVDVKNRDPIAKILLTSKLNYDELENQLYFKNRMDEMDTMGYDGNKRGEIVFSGTLEHENKNKKINASIEIVYHTILGFMKRVRHSNDGYIDIQELKVYVDDKKFVLKGNIEKDFKYGREHVKLDLSNKNLSIMKSIVNAKKSIIRLYGRKKYFDFVISDDMKEQLSLILDFISYYKK